MQAHMHSLQADLYSMIVDTSASADVPIRPAATVLALSPRGRGFDVLMVRRNRGSVFMGGAHVFPGGAVDPADYGDDARRVVAWDGSPEELPWRAAALRELAEEVGVLLCQPSLEHGGREGAALYRFLLEAGSMLDAGRLEYLSNWVTPVGPPRRFDTRFFVTAVSAGTALLSDRREVFDAVWVDPAAALQAADAGRWQIEFPTRMHLELLAGFDAADEVIAHAREVEPHRIEPRLAVGEDGVWRVLLPGETDFEAAR
jgi:8-oxo-dGTP pyrophosphatase MutT (NUDIX family)